VNQLEEERSPARPIATVSVEALAWLVATAAFLALRVAITWQAPVGGSELAHLSGAWNASIGVSDDRFVPTLAQALSSWLLEFSTSATPARVMVFTATATIPGAIYLLRGVLGRAGALASLLVVAVDPVAIWVGSAATASGFDLAITAWLLVAIVRTDTPGWVAGPLAFLAASAGPLPMLLALSAAIVALVTGARPSAAQAIQVAAGVALACVLASVGFGRGAEGMVIPPLAVLADIHERDWSTSTVADLSVFYAWPIVAAGGVGAIQRLSTIKAVPAAIRTPAGVSMLLTAWFAVGLAVLLTGLGTHAELPVVAATLPATLLAGPMLVRASATLAGARNPLAWLTLALVMFTVLLIGAIVADWARLERVGPANETARVFIYAGAMLVLLAGIAWFREPSTMLAVPVLVVASLPLLAGAIAVGTSASSEPLPSPMSGANARALRAVAIETIGEQGGVIAVHVDLEQQMTWSLRDTGPVVLATQVPPDASFVIWPSELLAPAGYTQATGTWSLIAQVPPPSDSQLRLMHWLVERHLIGPVPVPVAAYVRLVP